jgi:hypothetical protein
VYNIPRLIILYFGRRQQELSKEETEEGKAKDLGKEAQEAAEPESETQKLMGQEAAEEEPPVEEKTPEEAEEAHKTPEPMAIGDEKVAILKHDIYRKGGDDTTEAISIELVVKNISDTAIGSALFEADLYDIEGNTLDRVEQKTVDLKPNISRTIRINYSEPKSDRVRSYCVKVAKVAIPPEPKVTGNEKIKIIKHSLNAGIGGDYRGVMAGADIAIRNVSDTTIASLVFEAIFYDIEGNVLDTVKRREIELKPDTSRAVNINYTKQEPYQLRSYDVKITRMTTTDVEKVQLRRYEKRTTDAGEEVRGIVKNISGVKTDAALVATFFDPKKENIGTRVIILKDIEPSIPKQFHFIFKPMKGDVVRSYTLNIGDLVE